MCPCLTAEILGKYLLKGWKTIKLVHFASHSHEASIICGYIYFTTIFFGVKVNFTFCTIGSSLSVDHEGTMHLERCYAKETAFCTRQFVFFWPSWCVEAREFFWLVYKKRNFEILRRTVLLFTKIRWGQKVSIFLRNRKMCHMMLNYMI